MSFRSPPLLLLLLLLLLVTAAGRSECDRDDETCEWDEAEQPAAATAATSPAKPADDQCKRWADQGECKANAAYMRAECGKACADSPPPSLSSPPPQPATPDKDPHCGMWAGKGECEKNVGFMAASCPQACERHVEALKDKDPQCAEWAARGDCDTRHSFMASKCRTACLKALEDRQGASVCAALVARGECAAPAGLVQCRSSCLVALQQRLSPDTEGNCWYWGTDGECANNAVWMRKTCPRTCTKLEACGDAPHGQPCSAAWSKQGAVLVEVKVSPWRCPGSAPQTASGGPVQLGAPRAGPGQWDPSHRLGGSSEPPPKDVRRDHNL